MSIAVRPDPNRASIYIACRPGRERMVAARAHEAERRGVNRGFADTLRRNTTAVLDLTS